MFLSDFSGGTSNGLSGATILGAGFFCEAKFNVLSLRLFSSERHLGFFFWPTYFTSIPLETGACCEVLNFFAIVFSSSRLFVSCSLPLRLLIFFTKKSISFQVRHWSTRNLRTSITLRLKASCFFVATCHILASSASPNLAFLCRNTSSHGDLFTISGCSDLLKNASKI